MDLFSSFWLELRRCFKVNFVAPQTSKLQQTTGEGDGCVLKMVVNFHLLFGRKNITFSTFTSLTFFPIKWLAFLWSWFKQNHCRRKICLSPSKTDTSFFQLLKHQTDCGANFQKKKYKPFTVFEGRVKIWNIQWDMPIRVPPTETYNSTLWEEISEFPNRTIS